MDRAFLLGEIVNRFAGSKEEIGQVIDISVVGDLALLPKGRGVIKGVDIGRLAFIQASFFFISWIIPHEIDKVNTSRAFLLNKPYYAQKYINETSSTRFSIIFQ